MKLAPRGSGRRKSARPWPTALNADAVGVRLVAGAGPELDIDIVGPVCESGDFLAHDREMALAPGDLLAVLSAGAYGMVQSSNYNTRPRPAEVMVENGRFRLIRRRENSRELLALERDLDG